MFLLLNCVKRKLSGVTQKLYRDSLITDDRQRTSASCQPDRLQVSQSIPPADTNQSGG